MAKLAIKTDNQKQNLLLPPSLEEFIPKNHLVRVVNDVVDRLDLSEVLSTYRGGGAPCYPPKMLLKILVYAYLSNVYSSRRIAQQVRENINFMWLAGMRQPDFRTLNIFRTKHLGKGFDGIFTQVVQLLHEEGFVSLKVQYIDGTKIESAANKYTFVWRGAVEKSDARLKARTAALLKKIEEAHDLESGEVPLPEELDINEFERRVNQIREKVDKEKLSKQEARELKKTEEESLPKMKDYAEKLAVMGERNSYAKTDPDATFMRMKEDAMLNGQLKPGYNIQIATENQFITNFGVFANRNDMLTLKPFLESFRQRFGFQSDTCVADSGYGSEENYEYLENNGIAPYVKYNYFHTEQKRKNTKNPFLPQNLPYNADEDYYICPMGQHMERVGEKYYKSAGGYMQTYSVYQAHNCEGCPLRGQCHKARGNRKIEVNHRLEAYKRRARELLTSEQGLYHRGKRVIEPESVFGQIKECGKFRRLRLKGNLGAKIEFGLKAIAHNLRKMAAALAPTTKNAPNKPSTMQKRRVFRQFLTFSVLPSRTSRSLKTIRADRRKKKRLPY